MVLSDWSVLNSYWLQLYSLCTCTTVTPTWSLWNNCMAFTTKWKNALKSGFLISKNFACFCYEIYITFFHSTRQHQFPIFEQIQVFSKITLLFDKKHSMKLSQNDSLCSPVIYWGTNGFTVYTSPPTFFLCTTNSKHNLNFPSNKSIVKNLLKDIKQTILLFI